MKYPHFLGFAGVFITFFEFLFCPNAAWGFIGGLFISKRRAFHVHGAPFFYLNHALFLLFFKTFSNASAAAASADLMA